MINVKTEDIVKIVQEYNNYIKNVCRKYYLIGGTIEDLYQEGIIGLLEACKNYNGESLFEERFDSFVKICIKRQIFDAIKKANRKKNKALNESVSFATFDHDGDEQSMLEILIDRSVSNDPLDLFIDQEKVSERLSKCDKRLSDFEKIVLEHYLDGEKQSEIAQSLNKPVKSIDNTIQRIKNKLK